MRMFDLNDRHRHRGNASLQFSPGDTLTATLTGGFRYDDYPRTCAPFEWLSFGAGYVRELIRLQQRARPALLSPQNDWVSRNTDTVDTIHANVKAALLPKVLDFVVTANASSSLGRVKTNNPVLPATSESATAQTWPAFDDALIQVESKLLYHFLKKWTASLGYAYESFEKHDFRSDRLTPWTTGQHTTWLGVDAKGYEAHIIGATLRYRFE